MPKQKPIIQWGLIAVLTVLVAIAAVPSYIGGQWPWSADLPVPQLSQLRELIKTPLSLPGWEATYHQKAQIGGNQWSLTEYQAATATSDEADSTIALLLRPQTAPNRQPEVEWVDIQGAQSWQVDDLQTVRFTVNDVAGQPFTVSARYFRGLTDRHTFAVMQWYAWPTGGHFAPARWFWADQARQWQQRERMPWVAISVMLPIEPVGNIRPHTATAIAIAQTIHNRLLASTLQEG